MKVHGDELVALAARLATEAGRMVRAGREGGIADASTKSSATDVVTEFDRASEAFIVGELATARPGDGVIGEEGSESAGTTGVHWLIDPIDGTTNFLYGLPGYAVSIAASTEAGTEAAAVYAPATDELFTAVRGGGARLGSRVLRCSSTTELGHALIATGFSYQPERRVAQAQRVAEMIGRVRDIRRAGAASVDLCSAAAGRVDVYFERFLGPWDMAAGELIAREAGCRTGSFDGGPAHHSNVLVANPFLFDQMVELLASTEPGARPGIM